MHRCEKVEKKELLKESAVELRASLPWSVFSTYRAKAIKSMGAEFSIPGFRKGHVPEELLVKNIGEARIIEEMANAALSDELPLLLASEKVLGITTPQISITKLAPENPLEFRAIVEVLPQFTLPDYSKIAKRENAKREPIVVSEKEVEDVLEHLRRERAKIALIEKNEAPDSAAQKAKGMPKEELPMLDDAFVHGFGHETLTTFTEKLKENILSDKTARGKDKARITVLEEIIAATTLYVPHSLIDHEIHKMEAQFADDVSGWGGNIDAYLKEQKKTHEDLHKEWHEPAEKRAKMQLILGAIATKEGIVADEEKVKSYVNHTKKHHKDIPEDRIKQYYEHMLRNEAVLEWLESLK